METIEVLEKLTIICQEVDLRGGFTLSELMTVHDIVKFVQLNYPGYPKSLTPEILRMRVQYDGYTIDMLSFAALDVAKTVAPKRLHAVLGIIGARAALCLRNHFYIATNLRN